MCPLYIFDIDGTLALADHRRHLVEAPDCASCEGMGSFGLNGHFINTCPHCDGKGKDPTFKPDWNAFYDACDKDVPNMPVIRSLRKLILLSDVWFFSGRSDRVRDKTIAWLQEHVLPLAYAKYFKDEHLVMRRDGDYTPDDELKQQFLNNMLYVDRQRLVAVFDDRKRVVDMWRRNGIACFQVAEGNF